MVSPFFHSILAAENRILNELPTYLGIPLELMLPVALFIVAMVLGILYGNAIRMPDHGWRIGIIAGSFLAALSVILFWQYKLGVDLQGGAILVWEVDEKATAENHPQGRADDWKMSDLLNILKRRLNPDGLKEIVIRQFGPKQVEIVVPEVDDDEVDQIMKLVREAGVLRFLILADSPTRDQALWEAATEQIESAQLPGARLERNVFDPDDPTRTRIIGFWATLDRLAGTDGKPGAFAAPEALNNTRLRNGETGELIDLATLGPQAQAEFRLSPETFFNNRNIRSVEVLMAYDPDNDVRGSDLAYAREGMDEGGGWSIEFAMKGEGEWKMGTLTGENSPSGNITRKLGIVWDNKLVSAPDIRSTIRDRGQITGRFTQREVKDKVELLRSGSMPVVLKSEPISDDRIGATLGQDTVRKGSQAIIISLSIVLGFVLIYYRTAGVIACFALALNMLLTVALMFALKAPFTLPGLAGLVLTVGMSVDANVLIYERIREELERGASLRMAIRNGFDKALSTIIDSNVTTLLTAIILYVIGTDQVRGFGMTLILGIITSMYTAIFVSRTILEVGERAYRWTTLNMLKFFTTTNIDWMGTFKPAVVASVILIALGLAATFFRGAGLFDIDLSGGTSVQFILDPAIYGKDSADDIRNKLDAAFDKMLHPRTNAQVEHNVYQKFVAQPTGEEQQLIWKVDSSLDETSELQEIIRKAFRTEDGREGLQTYGVSVADVVQIQAGEAAPAPTEPASPAKTEDSKQPEVKAPEVKTDEPKAETPKAEEPKAEPAKTEEPKADAPKSDEPKAEPAKTEEPKSETPKADEPKAEPAKTEDADKKDGSCEISVACQETEPKQDDTKADDTKPAETKPETPEVKAVEPEASKTPATGTTTEPSIGSDPSSQIPPLSPVLSPRGESAGSSFAKTEAKLKFQNTTISADALVDRLQNAAKQAIGQAALVEVSNPAWNNRDNRSFNEWKVTFALPEADAKKVLAQLETELSNEPVWQTSSKIGGQVSDDTRWRAFGAIVGSIVVMIGYMWFRFHKISWGIAAAVALAHDALIMLGAIALSKWLVGPLGFLMIEEFKISLPVVAAFLTLIGYSVNDTIVIFDRIREIRGKSPNIDGNMVNLAVNQTLSRTLLTAGTTLVVIVILYFLGGSGIHAFAFALVVGVISGSYSTVFIASPLLVYLIGLDQTSADRKGLPSNSSKRGAA
jgi:SecD/SecF fusion protein